MYYLDKLLIIFIIIIIILLIINYNNNNNNKIYEHLEETKDNNTTLDALNNITNLIKKEQILSQNIDISNKGTFNNLESKKLNTEDITNKNIISEKIKSDNIDVKNLNISNQLLNKNIMYIFDSNATICLKSLHYGNKNPKNANNVLVFGFIDKSNNNAIISTNYFQYTTLSKDWLGFDEIKLNSYNITLKCINTGSIMGIIRSFKYQSNNYLGGLDVQPSFNGLILYSTYDNYNLYRFAEESSNGTAFSGTYYLSLINVHLKAYF